MKIGLFGSSFNPPHFGHGAVIRDFAVRQVFDRILVIPTYKHSFDKALAPFQDRMAMARLLVAEYPDIPAGAVEVSDIEQRIFSATGRKTYTFDLVEQLRREQPGDRFSILVGSDIRVDIDRWHRINELRQIAHFEWFPRLGYDAEAPYPEVSSTEVRQALVEGRSIGGLLIPTSIETYIREHGVVWE